MSGNTLQYTIVEYATTGITCANASPYLGYNLVQYNSQTGIIAGESAAYYDSRPVLVYNDIRENQFGLQTGNAITITHNRIADNTNGGVFADRGGTGYPGYFANNLIVGNGFVSLKLWINDVFTVTNNTVLNNDVGILIDGGFSPSTVYINNNNLVNNISYDFQNNTTYNIDASFNWWNTTSMSAINSKIYDFTDDFNLGIVTYTPILTAPEPDAPAFLSNLPISPADPIGIETATFDLTFSRPMDESIDPIVTFGSVAPYTTYQVLDNAQWLDESRWRATFEVTSLIPRASYVVRVSNAQGTDGMRIAADTRFGFTVDYAGEITDQTPPEPPAVIAGGVAGDASTVMALWTANDPDSTVTGYRYTIGSAPGATDIVNWTAVNNTTIIHNGLGLVAGRQYWVSVQARNSGGLWSASGYSSFVSGQPYTQLFLPVISKE